MSFLLTPVLRSFPGVSSAVLLVLYVGCVCGQGFHDDMMEPEMSSMLAYSSFGHQDSEQPGEAIGYNLPVEVDEEDAPISIVPTAYAPVSPPFFGDTNQTGVSNATEQRMPELRHRTEMKSHKASIPGAMPSSHSEFQGSAIGAMTGPAGPPGTQADIGLAAYARVPNHPGNPIHQPQHSNQQSGQSSWTMSFDTTPIPIVQHMPPYQGTRKHT
ncbi:hypothetical protein ZHAS_00002900 [Anopheles sinensis]|uniref:Uncharacterized protein n=1 Tax=Anopheles sinensis TaxID=74873 RepID=A0A084VD98_ANOSI|nr:hypothetical protein ZHAS_00002900 [Anopheles sinensis]